MIVVGLLGRIGAGKSTVAATLARRGARVVDADRLAHEALRRPGVIDAIARRHGVGVLGHDGTIDRRRLAAAVFGPTAAHAEALAALEAIVHPHVVASIEAVLREEGSGERIVVLDVPLLGTSNLRSRCDRLLEVVCDESVRQGRLAARGWSEPERKARDAAWNRHFPDGSIHGSCPGISATVDTSGDVRYTEDQVDRFLQSLSPRHSPGDSASKS